MRITAGEFGGRRLIGLRGAGRPTTDRVREAWFSILQPHLAGARVVDLFAGSGALGLEALSRGAEHVTFVERDQKALASLRENIASLGVEDRARVVKGNALSFATQAGASAFDIAFADPPYRADDARRLIETFRASPFASILGVEHAASTRLHGDETRVYGDVAITFCRSP